MKKTVALLTLLCLIVCCFTACAENEFDRVASDGPGENFGKKPGLTKTEISFTFDIAELGNNPEEDVLHYMYETAYTCFDNVHIVTYGQDEDMYFMIKIADVTQQYTYFDGQLYLQESNGESITRRKCDATYVEVKQLISSFTDTYSLPDESEFLRSQREEREDGGVRVTYTDFKDSDEKYASLAKTMVKQLFASEGAPSDFKLVTFEEDGRTTSSEFTWNLTAEMSMGEVKIRGVEKMTVTVEELKVLAPSSSESFTEVSGIDALIFG